jgi:hypothetical protein
MPISPLALPSPPDAVCVFRGHRAQRLSQAQFFDELGHTFMPGTPLMQAPHALAGYAPAVLDHPDPPKGYPDEIAIVAYASREIYDAQHTSSLSRRMYTETHWSVFDMVRSTATFPVSIEDNPADDADTPWYLFDTPIDWQDGGTRVAFITPAAPDAGFPAALRASARAAAPTVHERGCDQVIAVATPDYAAMWMHTSTPPSAPLADLQLLPAGSVVTRELVCKRQYMRGDDDCGVKISGAAAFSFIFSRDLQYFAAQP